MAVTPALPMSQMNAFGMPIGAHGPANDAPHTLPRWLRYAFSRARKPANSGAAALVPAMPCQLLSQ